MRQDTRLALGMAGAGGLVLGMVELGRAGVGLGPPTLLALVSFAAVHALPSRPAGRYALLGLFLALFLGLFALSAAPERWSGNGRLVLAAGCLALTAVAREAFTAQGLLAPGWGRWVVLITVGLLVAWFSGGAGGPGWMVRALVETFGLTEETARTIAVVLRKSIHFLYYGLLAWLAARAAGAVGTPLRPAIAFAAMWTLAHALFDEMRQLAAAGRTGTWADVVLDMAGAAFFLALWARKNAAPRLPVR